jgi:hypothetical protein
MPGQHAASLFSVLEEDREFVVSAASLFDPVDFPEDLLETGAAHAIPGASLATRSPCRRRGALR